MRKATLIIFSLIAFIVSAPAAAQLQQQPLLQKPLPVSSLKVKNNSARTHSTTLKLPFWDDFSFTPVNDPTDTLSNFPLDSIWTDSWRVYINEGLGINPPSVNVATFDGVDSLGLPYSDQLLETGFADQLMSQPIDLSTLTEEEKSTVFLSFFFQWQGNGEAPDAKDFIRVEFLNDVDEWITALTISPKASFRADMFYDTIVQVAGSEFFHDKFQFRFRNFGRQSGPYDTWNIDYIYLNKNRSSTDVFFPDGALASPIGPIFGSYNSVPIDHFRQTKQITPAQVDVFNLRGFIASYNYRAFVRIENYVDNLPPLIYEDTLVRSRGIGTNQEGEASGVINPFGRQAITLFRNPDPENINQFNPDADSIDITLKFKLVTNDVIDTLGNRGFDYYTTYDSIDFRANDSLSAKYTLKDYYAYDDGTAEYAAVLTQAGDRAAYRFDMLTTDPDTLVGIYVHIPGFSITSNQTVDLYVYNDVNGLPGNLLYTIPSARINRDSTTFQLFRMEPVVVEDRFYIGWRAPVEGLLRIGLDLNNNTGDRIFINSTGSWELNSVVNGSLMIRPRFGKGSVITDIPEEREGLTAFPNPNQGSFYLPGRISHLEVLSVTGQSIPYHQEHVEDDLERITLVNAATGIYILKIKRGEALSVQKILVR